MYSDPGRLFAVLPDLHRKAGSARGTATVSRVDDGLGPSWAHVCLAPRSGSCTESGDVLSGICVGTVVLAAPARPTCCVLTSLMRPGGGSDARAGQNNGNSVRTWTTLAHYACDDSRGVDLVELGACPARLRSQAVSFSGSSVAATCPAEVDRAAVSSVAAELLKMEGPDEGVIAILRGIA